MNLSVTGKASTVIEYYICMRQSIGFLYMETHFCLRPSLFNTSEWHCIYTFFVCVGYTKIFAFSEQNFALIFLKSSKYFTED